MPYQPGNRGNPWIQSLAVASRQLMNLKAVGITTTASTMIMNPSENHGYIIRLVDETLSSNKLVFGSSDNQNIDLHPKVVVEYSIYE